jgi:hypothetical protein
MIPEDYFSKGNVSKGNVSEGHAPRGHAPKGKVAVIAHDAGAANQIIHWFIQGDLSPELAYFSLSGPALVLARKALAEKSAFIFQNHSITDAIAQSDWVLAGTGWASEYEKEGMAEGIRQHKITIAVFDHWVNYEPRLKYQDRILDIDQIWVTDVYAQVLAVDVFPEIVTHVMPGRYLTYESSRVQGDGVKGNILFLMEPVRVSWQGVAHGEFQAFQFFLDHLALISTHAPYNIIIRPHPSDPEGKYQALLQTSDDFTITVSSDTSLYEALSTAEVVVGLNSYAMVVALAAGRKVCSVLPPTAPACVLPQPGIIELRTLI